MRDDHEPSTAGLHGRICTLSRHDSIMAATTIGTLAAAHSSGDLLVVLKDLKNSVIGNTWKKVQVAGDDEVLAL